MDLIAGSAGGVAASLFDFCLLGKMKMMKTSGFIVATFSGSRIMRGACYDSCHADFGSCMQRATRKH
jgi:hypothetical protein